jgi:phosphoserine phosphatase
MMTQNYILTCIGHKITPLFIEKVFDLVAKQKMTLQKTKRLAQIEYDAIEMLFSTTQTCNPGSRPQAFTLTKTFTSISERYNVDVAVQSEEGYFRKKQLVVMDLDSTLVAAEGIDELAIEAGVGGHVARITQRAMNGEIPFPEALRERVRLLKGLSVATLDKVYKRMAYTTGAVQFTSAVRKMGCKTAILSGGFDCFADRVKEKLHIDYAFSNRLEIKNNKLTGEVLGEIVDGKRKLALMEDIAQREGIPLDRVVAIGDGANDLPMITKAGLGVAFNAKPLVRKAAPYNITQKSLTTILCLFGISEEMPPVS